MYSLAKKILTRRGHTTFKNIEGLTLPGEIPGVLIKMQN